MVPFWAQQGGAAVTVRGAGEAFLFAAAFGGLFFVPVVMFLLPWALGQPREWRWGAMGLAVLAGAVGLVLFSWVARAMA